MSASGHGIAAMVAGLARDDGTPRDLQLGLIGRGIQLSRSPAMHEREAARLGLACRYALLDLDRMALPDTALGSVLDAVEAAGFRGVNVTHPFKQAVVPLLTDVAPEAEMIGAVNTVVFEAGRRAGHNTDCWGFAESFRTGLPGCTVDAVAQFGAGGAGAAVAYALMQLGVAELTILDADPARADRLAQALAGRFGPRARAAADAAACLAAASGIVNTTPVGMDGHPGTPFDSTLLAPRHWVADIVYFPRETELLRRARAIGCRTLEGAGMTVCQAVRAFALFTRLEPDREAMAAHFEAAA